MNIISCKFLKIILMAVVVLATFSCTPEPSCNDVMPKEEVIINYSYFPLNVNQQGIDPSDVKKITLFAFDSNGKFFESYTDIPKNFNSDYSTIISLYPGRYTFVSWFNLRDQFTAKPLSFEKGITTIEQALVSLDLPADDTLRTELPMLMHAMLSNAQITENQVKTFTLPIIQDVKRLNITVEGHISNPGEFIFSLNDKDGGYNFSNERIGENEFYYQVNTSINNENQLFATFNTLNLSQDRIIDLKIFNKLTGRTIYHHDIISLIKKAIEEGLVTIDWVQTNEYNLIIKFNADLTVNITINGWTLVEESNDI